MLKFGILIAKSPNHKAAKSYYAIIVFSAETDALKMSYINQILTVFLFVPIPS